MENKTFKINQIINSIKEFENMGTRYQMIIKLLLY